MGVEGRAIDAHHEAGHAIACYIYRVPIVEVWIKRDGTGGVRHRFSNVRKGTPRWSAYCRRRAIVSLAGPVAQMLFTYSGRGDPRWWQDRDTAKKWIDEIDQEIDWQAIAPALIEATFDMLMERPAWSAVEDIAKRLVKHGRLPGAFVEQLCRRFKIEQK
jgi:hypothetical protein